MYLQYSWKAFYAEVNEKVLFSVMSEGYLEQTAPTFDSRA